MSKHFPEKSKMIVEREELMLSPHKNDDEIPNVRTALFLKPTLGTNLPLPNPPSLSLSSKSHISLLKSIISFKGRSVPEKNWIIWVDTLLPTHHETWKKVGIFDAIRTTTYNIKNYNELIICLAEKWCSETNTFIFPFGEATITLEDVMILGGFSVLGEWVRTQVPSNDVEEIKKNLTNVFFNGSKSSFSLVQHSEWIEHFIGFGGELEHIAFLVLWLSRYVFPTQCHGYIHPHVFPIAISLARGTRIALAPAILAVIYRDLGLLKAKIMDFVSEGSNSGTNLFLWAPFQLVQLWVWERFTVLSPKPASSLGGEPRLARWKKSRKTNIRLLRFEFESLGECFLWKPYALYVTDKKFLEFYCDEGRLVSINSEVSEELRSFARCLRPCELVGLDCIEQYLPHRVGMQFGMDQDIPCSVSRCNQSLELAWSSYNEPLDGEVLCLPPRLLRGEVTARYFDWWRIESYSFKIQRRSKRIAKKRSRCFDVNVGKHGTRATVCLSSSCDVSTKSICVNGGEEMHIETIGVVPSQNIRTEDCTEMAPCCTTNLVSSVDGICNDDTPSFDKSVHDCENLSHSADDMNERDTPSFDKSVHDCENLSHNVDKSADDTNKREAPCFPSLCYTIANDEPGKVANLDTGLSRVSNLVDDPIVICDEEEGNGDLNRFLANFLEFESRISGLEEEYLFMEAAVARKQQDNVSTEN